jgi:hypothetical protein
MRKFSNKEPIKEGDETIVMFRDNDGIIHEERAICKNFRIHSLATGQPIYGVLGWKHLMTDEEIISANEVEEIPEPEPVAVEPEPVVVTPKEERIEALSKVFTTHPTKKKRVSPREAQTKKIPVKKAPTNKRKK